MDDSQVHYAKWEKPGFKAMYCVVHFYDFLEKVKLRRQKADQWLPGAGGGRSGWLQGPGEVFWVDRTVSILTVRVVTWLYVFGKSQNCTIRRVILNVSKFYLSEKKSCLDRRTNELYLCSFSFSSVPLSDTPTGLCCSVGITLVVGLLWVPVLSCPGAAAHSAIWENLSKWAHIFLPNFYPLKLIGRFSLILLN